MLAAVILSGGASSRMGSPKALLSLNGRTFLERLLAVTTHPKIGIRRVVLGPHAGQIAAAVSLLSDEIVINPDWELGQLSSLQEAIRSLPAGTDGLLLCPIDHPLIGEGLVDQLIENFYASHKQIILPVVPTQNGDTRRGHPVIFSSCLYDELLCAPLSQGARAVVWAHPGEIAEVGTADRGCVLNINDPETLHQVFGNGNR